MNTNTCCFLGHRKIYETDELKTELFEAVENLIETQNVDTFLFGSKSQFDRLAYDIVSSLQKKHPNIKRVYVRAEFPHINTQYDNYLLQMYEETYFPEKILRANRYVYVERNFEMIDRSRYCIVYYNDSLTQPSGKSGTKIALDYARRKEKQIIILN